MFILYNPLYIIKRNSMTKRLAIIYRIEDLVPTSERYQKYLYTYIYIEIPIFILESDIGRAPLIVYSSLTSGLPPPAAGFFPLPHCFTAITAISAFILILRSKTKRRKDVGRCMLYLVT